MEPSNDFLYHIKKNVVDSMVVDLCEGEDGEVILTFNNGARIIVEVLEFLDE